MEIAAGIDIVSGSANFPVYKNINECTTPADVIINFMPPTAALENALAIVDYSVSKKIPLVLCTTGMPDELETAIQKAAEKVAVLRSANMSLGINLLSNILSRISQLLYDSGFDIEITERHHNQKLDAPSGTALLLADAVNAALSEEMTYTTDRSKTHALRKRNEIGIQALRGGTIVGEHSAIFAGLGEVIELKHTAHSREIFAVGSLKAAEFLRGKPSGMYTMQDLMG
ncbi:MAG: 4-hydroxy-tetrahydrodipicolinate reductase, partial [Defluviitaleaceae bacterium]|nr:4-hydroxy-tetrahydrodipicolinate reductase [Defluviitaleaceae bacterium]